MKSGKKTPTPVVFSTAPEDFSYMGRNVPCQAGCPAHTNIPAYIRALHGGDYTASYEINRAANILPGVLGRICSRPCEARCRHGEPGLGQPVGICHIKRSAADRKKMPRSGERQSSSLGHKAAIVGSGPAGLAAAHDLATVGVSVTLFEALDKPGGMLRYGIPPFRLPRPVLDEEIGYILDLGVQVETGMKVGTDISVEKLLGDFDSVLLTAGCYRSKKLNIPGEKLPGVHSGLEFMSDVCRGAALETGERVLVIGDGFTAFDCARSAVRAGGKDVRICMLRTEEDLAVTKDERGEARFEGVVFETLAISRRILGKGKVEGVEFVRSRLGEIGEDGMREIFPIEGSEFSLAADSVVVAVGQEPEPIEIGGKQEGGVPASEGGLLYKRSAPGLYVAGDFLSGPSTVIEAIASGRRAAGKIAEDLTGIRYRERAVRMEEAETTDRKRPWDFIPRQGMPVEESVQLRLQNGNGEVETGYSAEAAAEEARRCYLCYLHYEIDMKRCIYCRYCIDVAPRDCIKLVSEIRTDSSGAVSDLVETRNWKDVNAVVIDNSRCIRCGACLRVCPVDCISVTKVERVERMTGEGDQGG